MLIQTVNMYTSEIYNFLHQHINDPSASVVVTSIDRLPKQPKLPLYCVVNEDISTNPGTHWIAIYINMNRHGIYLDSFGRFPLPEIHNFLLKNTKTFEISRIQLQMSTSVMCGLFSSIALVNFSRNKTLYQFLSNFSPYNRFLNELIINNMKSNNCVNTLSI